MQYEGNFGAPVYVKPRKGDDIEIEIRSAKQGIEFLAQFPIEGEPLMEAALDACVAATEDPVLAKDAEISFLSFAEAYDVLVLDPPPYWSVPIASKHRPL